MACDINGQRKLSADEPDFDGTNIADDEWTGFLWPVGDRIWRGARIRPRAETSVYDVIDELTR